MRKQKVFKAFMALALCLAIIAEAFLLPTTAVKAAQFGRTVTVTSSALKKAKANIVLYVNGNKLSKKGFVTTGKVDGNKEEVVYVPAKAFVEALGGKYTQKGKKVTISAEGVKITFKHGKNAYTAAYTVEAGDKHKYTLKYGKSSKKSKVIYVPIELMSSVAMFTDNMLDYVLDKESKTLDITLYPNGNAPVVGGWSAPESIEVPEVLVKFFENGNEANKDDEQIIPVAVLEQQVVAGMNYKLLCRISNPSKNIKEVYAIVVIYVDLQGEVHDVTSEIKTDIETNINNLPGGWSQPESVAFPEEYREIFDKAVADRDGVAFNPIAILGSQLVNGVNLAILCEATVVYPGATPYLVIIYANVNPLSKTGEITDIKSIDVNGPENIPDDGGQGGDDQKGFKIQGSENAVEGVDYMCMSGNYYGVTSLAGLAKVCEMEELPTGEFKTNIAGISSNMVLDFDISTMGEVNITNGAILTIENGGVLEAGVYVDEGAQIIVKNGGKLQTTQGGEIYNNGEIIIEDGAELKSQMGGTIWNAKPGKITINGTCYIGCVEYANEKQEMEKHIWLINDGKITGKGNVFIYAALGKDENPENLGYYQGETEKMLGNGMKVGIFEE